MIFATDVPENWELVLLGDIVSAQYGKALTEKSRLDSGPYNVVGSSGVVGKHNEFLVETPCIVIGRKGSVGAVHLMSAPSWPIDTTYFVFPPDGLQTKYLYYLLGSLNLARLDKSTAIPGINRGDLYRTQIPLAPVAEQIRIVEKLEELLSDLDAGVAELKAAQKKLTQYRQSLLKAAVEGTLTAEWRAERAKRGEPLETGAQLLERILAERRRRWEEKQLAKFKEQGKTPPKDWRDKYPEPVKPNTADLPELPEGWVWASVDQLSSFITSGSRGWADYYASSGALFIRSQDINTDRLEISEIARVELPSLIEGARTRVEYNDVLLTITGANVGKCAHVDVKLDESYVSQHVALIRPIDGFLGAYLHLYLTCMSGGRGQLNKVAYGAGKPGLNLQQVASVVVSISCKDEVREILSQMSSAIEAISQQMKSVELALKQSSAQRQNILKAAFSGQLVPQDPNDEPANVLMERIRAERAARESGGKRRGRKAKDDAA